MISDAGSDSSFVPEEEEKAGPSTQGDHLLVAKYRRQAATPEGQHDHSLSSSFSDSSRLQSSALNAAGWQGEGSDAAASMDAALVNVFLNHPDIESEVSERELRRLLHEEANMIVVSDTACRAHASFSSRVERTIGERPSKLRCLADTPSAGEYSPLVPTVAGGIAPRSAFKSETIRFREPGFTATPGPAAYLDRHLTMGAALTKCSANNGASAFVCGVPPYAAAHRATSVPVARLPCCCCFMLKCTSLLPATGLISSRRRKKSEKMRRRAARSTADGCLRWETSKGRGKSSAHLMRLHVCKRLCFHTSYHRGRGGFLQVATRWPRAIHTVCAPLHLDRHEKQEAEVRRAHVQQQREFHKYRGAVNRTASRRQMEDAAIERELMQVLPASRASAHSIFARLWPYCENSRGVKALRGEIQTALAPLHIHHRLAGA